MAEKDNEELFDKLYKEAETYSGDIPDDGYFERLKTQFAQIGDGLAPIISDPNRTLYQKIIDVAKYDDGYGHDPKDNPIMNGLDKIGTLVFSQVDGFKDNQIFGPAAAMYALRKITEKTFKNINK